MTNRFDTKPVLTDEEARKALAAAADIVRMNLEKYTYHFPPASSVDGIYPVKENTDWTTGFWTGEIWLSYELTGDDVYKYAALIQVEDFLKRIENRIAVDHHDMGFLYSLSCVAGYKLTGNEHAKKAALMAADNLITRFQEKGQFIQAWGKYGSAEEYRFIIDCLLNLPLLYWATEVTGDQKYGDIAHRHITTCLANIMRADCSTYHTFFMDPETGAPSHGATHQGYKDSSPWARGQAWGVYGTALSYRYTKNPEYKETFEKVTNFFLEKLSSDMVPYWDLSFTDGSTEPKDSSAAAVVACGLLEMAKYVEPAEAAAYTKTARQLLKALTDTCLTRDPQVGNGVLKHGTYCKKSEFNTCPNLGVDEYVSWGDYFYMEALTRLTKDWELYW